MGHIIISGSNAKSSYQTQMSIYHFRLKCRIIISGSKAESSKVAHSPNIYNSWGFNQTWARRGKSSKIILSYLIVWILPNIEFFCITCMFIFRISTDALTILNSLLYHSSCVGLMLWGQTNKPVIYLVKP